MASARFTVRTGSCAVIRESDAAYCGIVWIVGEHGSLIDVRVVVAGEDG